MPIDPTHAKAAARTQQAAARDSSQYVRLIAGPGTGKSFVIEERISWLLARQIQPDHIFAVSFTRASARDLRNRVRKFCIDRGQSNVSRVSVGTLHSLALRTLRLAGSLSRYPADPLVLDNWELENIFDDEFGHSFRVNKERRQEIRLAHEALWSTGQWNPANYVLPKTPVSQYDRTTFGSFHRSRAQVYSCVLPGEIIRQCVEEATAGTLSIVNLLQLRYLVVDEYQDLNPMDLKLVDIIARCACVFVAGDDDQSIYSFRFASPSGIQHFPRKYPSCGQHTLDNCFRCTPDILNTSQSLIRAQPNRITKTLRSLYGLSVPPVSGVVHRWCYPRGDQEALSVAESCRDLIASGLDPRDILILISDKRVLLGPLRQALDTLNVAYEPPQAEGFLSSPAGRVVLSLIRIVCQPHDYIAHRALVGLQSGVGIQTCCGIVDSVLNNGLNFRSIFYGPIPTGVFRGRMQTAVNGLRTICSTIASWSANDPIHNRMVDIENVVRNVLGPQGATAWVGYANAFPNGMTLEELRDYLLADTDEQHDALLATVYDRLGLPFPKPNTSPSRLRMMTMHGAKGLSAKVVFIPGCEDEVMPGLRRRPYAGLVLEAARLLYVSITRARACCILSYAQARVAKGRFTWHTPSRFNASLAGPFVTRRSGLSSAEVRDIRSAVSLL